MKVLHRIYSDYLLPSRLSVYDNLLSTAVQNGYEHLTVSQFYFLVKNKQLEQSKKHFIHRHDIDTDTGTARAMFEIEKKHKVKSSWYFRLNTMDLELMKEIHAYGSEVGYHFEELSDYCKLKRIKTKEEVIQSYPEIRKRFKQNFVALQNNLGFKIKSIASHGDFVNRVLGMPNFSFVNSELLTGLGIDFECYDDLLLNNYENILSDTIYPHFYKPNNPLDLMQRKESCIYLLSHPRHWRKSLWINSKDNMMRFYQGLKY